MAEGRHINFIPGSYRRQKQTQPRPADLTDLRKWDTLILGIFVYVYKLHHTHVGPIDQSSVCVVIKRYTRIIDCLFSIDINLCEIIHFL